VSDEDSDKIYGEELDTKEQAPIPPCHGMYRLGCVTDQSAGHRWEFWQWGQIHQGVSQWGQRTGQTKTNIFQFIGDWHKTECGTPYKWRSDSLWSFNFFNLHPLSLYWWRRLAATTNNTWTYWWWTFSCTWCHWIWNVSVSGNYYLDRTWRTWQPERQLVNY
jgi:hypothetical protein